MDKTILFASSEYFPDRPSGASRVSYDLARAAVVAGFNVWFLCQDVALKGQPFEEDEGLKILRYPMTKGRTFNPLRNLEHIKQAKKTIGDYIKAPVDIIHGHTPIQYISSLRTVSGENTVNIYTIHSPAIMELAISWGEQGQLGKLKRKLGLPLVKRMERDCLLGSDILTCLSNYTKSLISGLYGKDIAETIIVCPGWVDEDHFYPKATREEAKNKLSWPMDVPVFFCLRRLTPRMGLENLLKACQIMACQGLQFYLLVGGVGPLLDVLIRATRELGIEEYVSFLGKVDEVDLPYMYTACDASIIPTEKLECFGLIAIESLACGTPALVTPVGALPEIIAMYDNSWISNSNKTEDISKILGDYISGKIEQSTPDDIRRRTVELYSREARIADYLNLYESAAKAK